MRQIGNDTDAREQRIGDATATEAAHGFAGLSCGYRGGTGEPLLLLHGLGRAWRDWLPVIPGLAEARDVIAVDLPGHGASQPLSDASAMTVPNLANIVETELDRLGIETVHIGGSSIGGWLALELARRGRARTVVAISPGGLGTPAENRRTRRLTNLLRRVAPLFVPVAGPVSKSAVGRMLMCGVTAARPWRIEPAEAVAETAAFVHAAGVEEMMDWFVATSATGLDEVICPVTIAWGSRDKVLPCRQAARFKADIPQAEIRVLKGLGHVPMSDDAELLQAIILRATMPAHAASRG
jgi:pimeloyl-ACP methyl ester carboxylesterase